MLVLALDSSASGCAVCVWRDGSVVAVKQEAMERGQDARLVPLVQEVMEQASISFDSINRIAVSRGPGSFTGLRIGLATARGFGLAAGKPVLGVDRFLIYQALFAQAKKPLAVVLESRRLELYVRLYDEERQESEPLMLPPDEIVPLLQNRLVVGDAQETMKNHVDPLQWGIPSETEVIICAALAAQADECDPSFLPRPFYLRAPDVTIKCVAGEAS